jgi:hypothetical protein
MTSDTESTHWGDTTPEQRSFLVEVLHWFHYRTTALKRSWVKEEVLTWELLRALELLPQSMFLRPLLQHISGLSDETREATAPLLASPVVEISRYPSLHLTGSKRNCSSDIGFGPKPHPPVWIEAKTAPFRIDAFREQLLQQKTALNALLPEAPTVVVALLPHGMETPDAPTLSWRAVHDLFEAGVALLRDAVTSDDLRQGYEGIATEMVQRIATHPNRIAGT